MLELNIRYIEPPRYYQINTILKYSSKKKPEVKFGQVWWVVHAFDPSPQEAEVGGWISVILRQVWFNIERPSLEKTNKQKEDEI